MKGERPVLKANLLTGDVEIDAKSVSKLSKADATELVNTLQSDKRKLQKLVIAQKEVVKSARLAHDQSRELARDAVTIMRDARDSQKLAEKRARRERAKRLQIEEKIKHTSEELKNALSIVEHDKRASLGVAEADQSEADVGLAIDHDEATVVGGNSFNDSVSESAKGAVVVKEAITGKVQTEA